MRPTLFCLTIALLPPLAPAAAAQPAPAPAAEDLEDRTYSLTVTGAVAARGEALPIDEADPTTMDRAVLAGEADEKFLYGPDPIDSDASREAGPHRILALLGPDHVAFEGRDDVALQVSLHLSGDVTAGEYAIEDSFFDVGPNEVPVSAMAVAVSADRSVQVPFVEDVQGSLTLEAFGDEATGEFTFSAAELGGDRTITASGAFRGAPYALGEFFTVTVIGVPRDEVVEPTDIAMTETGSGLRVTIAGGPVGAPRAEITLTEEPEAKFYGTRESDALSITLDGEPAAGKIEFTDVGDLYSGEFTVDGQGDSDISLRGAFDYIRPAR